MAVSHATLHVLPAEVVDRLLLVCSSWDDVRALMRASTQLYDMGTNSRVWDNHRISWYENSWSHPIYGLIPSYARRLVVPARLLIHCLQETSPARYSRLTSLHVVGESLELVENLEDLTQLTQLVLASEVWSCRSWSLTALSMLRDLQLVRQTVDGHWAHTIARLSLLTGVHFARGSVRAGFGGSFSSILAVSLRSCEVHVHPKKLIDMFPNVCDVDVAVCRFQTESEIDASGLLHYLRITGSNSWVHSLSGCTALKELALERLPNVPSSIGALQCLQALTLVRADFSEDPLVDQTLHVVSTLTQLTQLDVNVLPCLHLLQALTRLVKLSVRLASGFHTGVVSLSGVELPHLQSLHMSSDALGRPRGVCVSHLNGLTQLMVDGMEVLGMQQLSKLVVASVSHSTNLCSSDLRNCIHLTRLSLQHVSVDSSFLASMRSMESLILDVHGQQVSCFLTSLRGMRRLTELRLQGDHWITTPGYEAHISALSNLRSLVWDFRSAQIDLRLASSILPLRRLTGLDMADSRIPGSSAQGYIWWKPVLQHLKALPCLRQVYIPLAPENLMKQFPQWLWHPRT